VTVLEEVETRAREVRDRWDAEDCGVLTVREFCRYAAAVGDQGYVRRARAREAAGEPVEAPLLYLSAVMSWEDGPAEEELRPDGLTSRESPCTRGLPVRQVHGGQTVRLGRVPVAGTRITAARALTSARRRQGRSGEFVLLDVTTRFTSGDGEELMVVDETIVVMDNDMDEAMDKGKKGAGE
jgi:hypothetical protein